MNLFEKAINLVFGTKHERDSKRMKPIVAAINAREAEIESLNDDALRGRFEAIRERVRAATAELPDDRRERSVLVQSVLDPELEEVFALVREASKRATGMRHFDVQLMGGIVLHEGRIAEMRTGEGKTLVATLPVCLNALTGRGVHVVTVNDYLARRDAEWMGKIYNFLGLTVGCIQNQMNDAERKEAYGSDITYGTNNEFGFDYLRDNMKFELDRMVQRGHVYAIVDEVDSILVDEARTPLIISGPSEVSVDLYYKVDAIIPRLKKGEEIEDKHGNKEATGDYLVDEKAQTAVAHRSGHGDGPRRLLAVENLYDPSNIEILHAVNQALRAHTLFQRDKEYIVKDGEVIIVDEFTGRLMSGRRWSDGLHQAVEAKEKVKIQSENQTLATITLQNYFRMYDKLAGMTGTAETEAEEFEKIYGLDVSVIPTNMPMIRADHADVVYKTEKEKFRAVIDEIEECNEHGQPVLVGTVSIENSERLAKLLAAAQDQACRAQRQVPRTRGRHRRPGRPPRGGHHRHQHGGPRHRHRSRRQPRRDWPRSRSNLAPIRRSTPRSWLSYEAQCAEREATGPRGRRSPHPWHRAPRVASDRQPVARSLRTPGRPRVVAVLPLARRRSDADLRLRLGAQDDGSARNGGGHPDRVEDGLEVHRTRAEAGRGPQLRDPQTPARVRRRHEQAARGGLQLAPSESSKGSRDATTSCGWSTRSSAR